ncbi:MAG: hypothetical protein JWQ27_447 [Ferruginibacter sp.]|nr:hypothetical protein [Ferruginibacter sp.]
MLQQKKSLLLILFLGASILFLARCLNHADAAPDPRGKAYAGAITCRQCHQAIYDSFLNTAHFKASALALPKNIQGNFLPGKNSFAYNDSQRIDMLKRGDSYQQVFFIKGREQDAYKLDMVFGTRHAQTYLYLDNGQPYELPLSHYNAVNAWGTSPGFSASSPNFKRFIGAECFECHSSSLESKLNSTPAGVTQVIEKETLIYGIDCERCHGPASQHVAFHEANPDQKMAAFMVKNSTLGHQQKLDACAVCHSGNDQLKIDSRFRFKMGDDLGNFFMPQLIGGRSKEADVHGNQYMLMASSKCFIKSPEMTCGSCHSSHESATGNLKMYSQKCMSCHQPEANNFCPKYPELGEAIKQNCIDCHMPQQPSSAIGFQLAGTDTKSSYLLRTHKIAVYRDSLQTVHHKK